MMRPIEIAARSIVLAHPQGSLMSLSEAVAAVKRTVMAADQTDLQIADLVAKRAIEAGVSLEFDMAEATPAAPATAAA